ncbi:MAG TPA: ABC transporter permease [Ktedonobacteraceae bacterium]|nr:ABC transporter permease [Ktedonobacteraceae bacterium]
MDIPVLTSTGEQTRAMRHSHPLLNVMVWELRRFYASRLFWLQALGFFCFMLFVTWAQKTPEQFGRPAAPGQEELSGFIAGTSSWGLLQALPSILLVLILLLPFITADGVARDLQRRTHELLLTTALPTWAYVWGRYLIGLLIGMGLAVLLLAAVMGMGLLLHLTVPAYPLPPTNAVLLLWVGMVVPAVVLVSSLSFALSTLLPRMTTLVKFVILVIWVIGAVILPSGLRDTTPPAWYVNWDPTSAVTALGLFHQYSASFNGLQGINTEAQLQQYLLAIENKVPDITGWLAPHLLLAVASLLLVLVTALIFKRFRNMFT